MPHSLQAPFTQALPVPLFLRTTLLPDDAVFPSHIHSWGEFVYSHNGLVQVMVERQRYLVPPQYGIWLPPNVQHIGLNRQEVLQSSLYVTNELCSGLPSTPQALMVSPFMRSILEHVRETGLDYRSQRYLRLLTVFLDELSAAPQAGSFLPATDDPVLGRILHFLESHPEDNRSVAALAGDYQITERTLARRCRQVLGMPLTEWRNRRRVVSAIALLDEGQSVATIAAKFGYSSTSAFIAMFRKLTGATPTGYRKAS